MAGEEKPKPSNGSHATKTDILPAAEEVEVDDVSSRSSLGNDSLSSLSSAPDSDEGDFDTSSQDSDGGYTSDNGFSTNSRKNGENKRPFVRWGKVLSRSRLESNTST